MWFDQARRADVLTALAPQGAAGQARRVAFTPARANVPLSLYVSAFVVGRPGRARPRRLHRRHQPQSARRTYPRTGSSSDPPSRRPGCRLPRMAARGRAGRRPGRRRCRGCTCRTRLDGHEWARRQVIPSTQLKPATPAPAPRRQPRKSAPLAVVTVRRGVRRGGSRHGPRQCRWTRPEPSSLARTGAGGPRASRPVR